MLTTMSVVVQTVVLTGKVYLVRQPKCKGLGKVSVEQPCPATPDLGKNMFKAVQTNLNLGVSQGICIVSDQ